MEEAEIRQLLTENSNLFVKFQERVKNEFLLSPEIKESIHSVKFRIKDIEHLVEKAKRKVAEGRDLNVVNFFHQITDIAGIRVLHINNRQFEKIHGFILKRVQEGEFVLFEEPIAYTWDPESVQFYEGLGIRTALKDSYYTSIHYVVMPKTESIVKCEIQVRNLFEEVWGEVDHLVNYPRKSELANVREQLKVLARLSSTGSKLVDCIFNAT